MRQRGIAVQHTATGAQIQRTGTLFGGAPCLLMAQAGAGGQLRHRREGVACGGEDAVVLALGGLPRGQVVAVQPMQRRADEGAEDRILAVAVGRHTGHPGQRLVAGRAEARLGRPFLLPVVDAAGQCRAVGHVEVVAGRGHLLIPPGSGHVQRAGLQLPLRTEAGHRFVLFGALGGIVDVGEVTGTAAAIERCAVGAVVEAGIQRQVFILEHARRAGAQMIGQRVHRNVIARLPAQLALQVAFADLAARTGRCEVLQVGVLIGAHERHRAGQAARLVQRPCQEAIESGAIAVAEPGAAHIDLALACISRAACAHQYQAGFAVGAVQRALRAAQHLHRLDLVEHGIAQLAERNAIDVDRGTIDQEWIGLDAADRDEHVAELAHRIELDVRRELVEVTELGDARFFQRLPVEHRHRQIALQVRGIALGTGDADTVERGRVSLLGKGGQGRNEQGCCDERGSRRGRLQSGNLDGWSGGRAGGGSAGQECYPVTFASCRHSISGSAAPFPDP